MGEILYVRDLKGVEYPLQATIKNNLELNGNQSVDLTIYATDVNNDFIDDITEMWELIDFENVVHKIIYLRKKGEGKRLAIDVKAIPLFFDAMDTDRIYEEYNEHMTAQVAFARIFEDTGFEFVLMGQFDAVQWEGFGGGESRLETFKRAIERYKCEFRINGNTVYLESQIGRDTEFQYRYRLNASNIVKEMDASAMWTYGKGYGDYDDDDEEGGWENAKLVREYESPLAKIIGVRHAPPIKDGRIKDVSTMDRALKELVEESLKISVSADIHDLRKQGYPLAQPELGDRVFLIDERIALDEEVRVVDIEITRNWRGEVIDLSLIFGSEGLTKRHRSNLQTAIKDISDVMAGRKKIPYSVLDNAVLQATQALRNAQTELIFSTNGILSVDKNNPNFVTLLNSAGFGVSRNGGATFENAITGDGINATVIRTGTMLADRIAGGILSSLNSNTVFNLNTGKLDMQNTDFTLGGQANLFFADKGNRVFYQKANGQTLRASGIGVGDSLNDRYPLVFMGVSTADKPQASDGTNFSGFIANATERANDDANGNSANGLLFDVRDKPVNYTKGFRFDLRSNSPSLLTFRNDLYDYDFGVVNRLLTKKGFTLRNYGNEQSGWLMETNYSGSGDAITLRGLNGGTYVYQIGADSTNHRIRNIYLANHPNVESDERLKEDVKESDLGLSFINDIQPKTFRFKPKGGIKERTHFGVLAQQLEYALSEHGVDIDDVSILSKGSDGFYGVEYSQLIIPIIKAIQELHAKMEAYKSGK